jgi:hypothetical protein
MEEESTVALFGRKKKQAKEPAFNYWITPLDPELEDLPSDLRQFLDGIIDESGEPVDESMREEKLRQMARQLQLSLARGFADVLPSEKRDEFMRLREGGAAPKELADFLNTYCSGTAKIELTMAASIVDFKQRYV